MNGNGVVYLGKTLARPVKNLAGEELGEVKDLTLDMTDGRVSYAIIKLPRGFMQHGKLFAVPWDVLQMSKDEKCLILDFDKAVIENVPTFDEHNWPNVQDRHWGNATYAFFGGTPYWERDPERYRQPAMVGAGPAI